VFSINSIASLKLKYMLQSWPQALESMEIIGLGGLQRDSPPKGEREGFVFQQIGTSKIEVKMITIKRFTLISICLLSQLNMHHLIF